MLLVPKRGIPIATFILTLVLIMGCDISRSLLYYPQQISGVRLQQIKEKYHHISEHTIAAEDGKRLHGWLIEKNLSTLPTIFYFGGNAEEVSLNIEDFDQHMHANIVLFNYRGYGLSEGRPEEKTLKSDAQLILDHFTKVYRLRNEHIILMGRSIGSGIACYLAANNRIHKTILVTPYASIESVAKDHFPGFLVDWLLTDSWDNLKLVENIRSEVLLLVAANDEIIAPKHADELYNAIDGKITRRIIQPSNHNTISFNPEYWLAIRDYINQPRL